MRLEEGQLQECPRADELMAMARASTGLDDLGDPARNTDLNVYLTTMAEEAWPRMTGHARALAVDYLIHQLKVRLKLVANRKTYPMIAKQRIEAPLIVVGPPRGGTGGMQHRCEAKLA
jgi:hypothetical protein